ncbi:uncharacterized protein BX663DRAFT_517665 [Cokeromyces recurvatus]|uniref:uncharacterized protein n=1 Tax=Cokeromyces recurvatus TaxID=90255 RepID=UPI00221F655F|nr:uncharacterized protein BX663DRAFT_157307 [Cokeromyces recurvatus]XP_051380435.1 uncharacterized protein BX663DRAFT_517665 [Cokeromyces recurvatus]KAI7900449.1 hypothetical protein BX663DRAFT_157307 [Cokeromyces recurvatus]KAI7900450.1 hypothetical protein BX663DRAFT_517665 [Cokeromyces recurvatus]
MHESAFHPYSPEANNIIRSGNGVSPKPYLDRDLYNKHMKARAIDTQPIPHAFHKYIDAYIDSNNFAKAKKEIRSLSLLLSMEEEGIYHNISNMEFLEQLLIKVHTSYTSHIDYQSSEDTFNQLFVWPYLNTTGRSIVTHDCKSNFLQGQPVLESMNRQLKALNLFVDEKSQNKSDGLIKLFGLKNLELVLLETSGHFTNSDKGKIKLDHHKGMYGVLSMLKCVADDFSFASADKFSSVKVFFIHTAETELHLWSVRYQDGLYDFWREHCLEIRPDFEDRAMFVPQLIEFCWNVKYLLEKAVEDIIEVKKDHQINSAKYRYNPQECIQLSAIINPIILKLTKEDDNEGMGKLGPMYSPPSLLIFSLHHSLYFHYRCIFIK